MTTHPTALEMAATLCFLLAIIHTFLCPQLNSLAKRFPDGSFKENFLHLLGEVEVVFGFWAGLFFIISLGIKGIPSTISYMESLNFTEPLFVFAIMIVAATKPMTHAVSQLLVKLAKVFPLPFEHSLLFMTLALGPILGSLITEPAAITITALILNQQFFAQNISPRFKYLVLACLFVNISIGGALTPYAAPPILMVSRIWNWDLSFMLQHFALRVLLSVFLNSSLTIFILRKELNEFKKFKELKELKELKEPHFTQKPGDIPFFISFLHMIFLGIIVLAAHHKVVFLGVFLFFVGMTVATKEYQEDLKLRDGLMVFFFLSGLIVLGGLQEWWLSPLIQKLTPDTLYLSSTFLTAFTDNAALTYLGSQVPNTSLAFQYSLVAGAISGGGLTVIANAPNPVGFAILGSSFKEGLNHFKLFLHAALFTTIAIFFFWPW